MKKIILLSFAFLGILTFSGCNKNKDTLSTTPETILNDIDTALEDLDTL